MRFKDIDWLSVKADYENGLTLRQLHKTTGIDRKTLLRGLRSVETVMRAKGHRLGVPSSPRHSLVNRNRECSECSSNQFRIVVTEPPLCRGCWDKKRRSSAFGKNAYLIKKYGVTLVEAEEKLEKQNGGCAICQCSINLFKKPWQGGIAVDHDHETGEVRGLLCHSCNVAIGLLSENCDSLSGAQRYLAKFEAHIDPTAELFFPLIMTRPDCIFIGAHSRLDSFTKLEGGVELRIGAYVHVASGAHLGIGGGTTIIEDYAAVASGGRIISGSNQVRGLSISACAPDHMQRVEKSITILKKYSCVFVNATVLPGVILGEGAVLAAGAVATKAIPEWEIWGGIPAKFIAKREVLR